MSSLASNSRLGFLSEILYHLFRVQHKYSCFVNCCLVTPPAVGRRIPISCICYIPDIFLINCGSENVIGLNSAVGATQHVFPIVPLNCPAVIDPKFSRSLTNSNFFCTLCVSMFCQQTSPALGTRLRHLVNLVTFYITQQLIQIFMPAVMCSSERQCSEGVVGKPMYLETNLSGPTPGTHIIKTLSPLLAFFRNRSSCSVIFM